MTKYQQVAQVIEKRIAELKLGPGDSLPSERQLAGEMGVAYGTIRLAYDHLYRKGIIDRQQGRGTFIADPARDNTRKSSGRLGLLAVDMVGHESQFLRRLTYEIQRRASMAGFELTLDQLNFQDMASGRLPMMLQKRSVDGYFIYGKVKDFHIHLLNEHPLPYLLIGNRPVPAQTPQITFDIESLVYQMTQQLIQAGCNPVWLDANPDETGYEVGMQMFRGYQRAIAQSPDHQQRVLRLSMNQLDHVLDELAGADLHRSAFIIQDWTGILLKNDPARRLPGDANLWLVPMPHEELCNILQGQGIASWHDPISMADLANPAFDAMLEHLQKTDKPLPSIQVELTCKLQIIESQPVFNLNQALRKVVHHRPAKTAAARPSITREQWLG